MVLIRKEEKEDEQAITGLLKIAFADHPHSQQTEHLIVQELRKANALTLAYVAVSDDGKVIGYIAFSHVEIGDYSQNWYGLGPIAVLPEEQHKGVGSELMKHGLQALEALGAKGCVLVGDPEYYGRFGFSSYAGLEVENIPQEYVLAYAWNDKVVAGEVLFHKAFSVNASNDVK